MPNPKESPKINTDHLIIGAGVAGLQLSLRLAVHGRVVIITKSSVIDNNSWHAQGGMATVMGKADSFDEHVKDTIEAGAGLCHESVVRKVVEAGPKATSALVAIGVKFTRDEAAAGGHGYHLTREGGHSHRRVIHAEDLTGREIVRALLAEISRHPNITLMEDQFAIDLITTDKYAPHFAQNSCLGAYVLNRVDGRIYSITSRRTYLCTGGHGKVYLYTSNPDSATGDGLAMGWRAGCRVGNLEFMQFHPTCLFHPRAKNFLISEALRGEGAVLRNQAGDDFVSEYHPRGSLAPRDVVARAIDSELKKSGAPYVYLDARSIGRERIMSHFPNIFERCQAFGIDITTEMIPVVPAAHYSCGGIIVDECGKTNLNGLYALGEVACTGLHGANRLASNSLLEALVFADIVAEDSLRSIDLTSIDNIQVPCWDDDGAVAADEICVLHHLWEELRRLMWNYVGIVRTTKRLERALSRVRSIRSELHHYYWSHQVTGSVLEVRNLADVAYLTIRCGMRRRESRGTHYTSDFPEASREEPQDTILSGSW